MPLKFLTAKFVINRSAAASPVAPDWGVFKYRGEALPLAETSSSFFAEGAVRCRYCTVELNDKCTASSQQNDKQGHRGNQHDHPPGAAAIGFSKGQDAQQSDQGH